MEIIYLLSVAYAEDYCVALNTVSNKYPTAKCSAIRQLTGITVIYYRTVSLYNRRRNQNNHVFILHYVSEPIKMCLFIYFFQIRITYMCIKHHEINCQHINSLFNYMVWKCSSTTNHLLTNCYTFRSIVFTIGTTNCTTTGTFTCTTRFTWAWTVTSLCCWTAKEH